MPLFACLYSSSASRDTLEQVARAFSPRIETPGDGLVLLDISGLGRLLGEPRAIAEELLKAAATVGQGFSPAVVAVTIAGTRIAAQLLARDRTLQALAPAARQRIIEPGAEAAAVAPLPLDALTPLGAPPELLATLSHWGLRTLGDFAALPAIRLASRIGQPGLAWQKLARGEDLRPLVPAPVEERFEEMLDLEWPIEGVEPLAFVLGRLLDPLCARLELRGRAVANIELRLRFAVSRAWQLRRLELPAPMRDPRTLRTLLCLDLESHPEILIAPEGAGGGGIDRIGLFIEPTPGRIAQFSLLARPTVAPEAVATLMARLHALMGQDRCGTARLVDTHRPDAFMMAAFTSGSRVGDLRRPATAPRGLRRWRHPLPARVIVEHGRPVRVVTDRRGFAGGGVTWCSGPWRTSGDWWTLAPGAEPGQGRGTAPYSWQEWDVALSDGGHYLVHEDRQRSRWFIDAILD